MRWKVLCAAAFVCALAGSDVLACGNKFLVTSRGTRFGKVPIARQEAKILVYAPPNSALTNALGKIPVSTLLTEVGYKPTTVSAPEELDSALRLGGWNLVLADTSALPRRLEESDVPAILPVLHEPSRTQLAEAKATYGQVIKSPTKSQRFVESVDIAVAEQASRRPDGAEVVAAR